MDDQTSPEGLIASPSQPRIPVWPQALRRYADTPLRSVSQSVLLQAPIEGASAEAEGFGGLTGVAAEAGKAFLDQELFDFFEAHVLNLRRDIWLRALQTQIARPDFWTCRHEDRAFNRVIQFSDVAGPCVRQQGTRSVFFEALKLFPVPFRMPLQEMIPKQRNVFTTIS
jgi:hypothetical protein